MGYQKAVVILLVLAACCCMPAMGAIKYFGASPQLSATISGQNEYRQGEDATITVIVQNSGVTWMKFNNSGTLQPDDNPTTAKMVMVSMDSGNAPVIIKSDPQLAGDIASPGTATVRIRAKILSNATIGEYQIPLTLRYKYLIVQDQEVSEMLQFQYNDVTTTQPITIRIKPQVKIDVVSAESENLNSGTEGYLTLTIKNTGSDDGRKATVKLIRNHNSPIIPTDSSVFIGDFPRDGSVICRYKVAVSNDAKQETYPVDVTVTYENSEGDIVTSTAETVGVPVGGKISFTVSSQPVVLYPGENRVVSVEYQNTGTSTAFNAQARLNVVDPFSSSDNGAYLGNVKPGERVTAQYSLGAGKTAVENKMYYLDTEIRFRDALDNSQTTDMFKAPVQVVPRPPKGITDYLPVLILVAAVIIGAGYYLLVVRKKK